VTDLTTEQSVIRGRLEGLPRVESTLRPRTLPKERYTSREVHEAEKKKLWPAAWLSTCREENIPNPGDYFEYTIVDQSIVLVRQHDGGIKAFHNACSHRGMPLVCGTGTKTDFRCPFHAWTYSIDGAISSIPSPDEFAHADYSLPSVRVDTWGGYVFVNMDGAASTLQEYLAPATDILDGFKIDDMIFSKVNRIVMPCNWKLAIEAFIEAYHLPGTHPQTILSMDDVNTTAEKVGIHSFGVIPEFTASPRLGEVDEETVFEALLADLVEMGLAPDRSAELGEERSTMLELPDGMTAAEFFIGMQRQLSESEGVDLSHLTDRQLREYHLWLLFPNLVLQVNGPIVLGWRAYPNGDDPDSCILEELICRLVGPDSETETTPWVEYASWHDYECPALLRQDFSNLERMQVGVKQRGYRGVVLAEQQEIRIVHMADVIEQYLARD
jgi:phenylpropionate dioxygenase-like ring-hydroxylating dioxygenase large terminal subunit